MNVNLPFLGASASGPSVSIFIPADAVEVDANIVVPAATRQFAYNNPVMVSKANATEYSVDLDININGCAEETVKNEVTVAQTAEVFGVGGGVSLSQNGLVVENDLHVGLSMTGSTSEKVINNVTVSLPMLTDTHEYDFHYELLNIISAYESIPFYAAKIVAEYSVLQNLSMLGDAVAGDNVILAGSAIEQEDRQQVDINVPVYAFGQGDIEKVVITGVADVLDYAANVSMTTYDVNVSVPITLGGEAVQSDKKLTLGASVDSVDILIDAEVYDEGSIRYEVADIDHGLANGRMKIFPETWTLCYVNKPVKEDGTLHTVSSFVIEKLKETYGEDIHNKISMIVAKHPESGEQYNFVVQDGYMTPIGSVNDFELCYLRDGVFYPIPFMVKSITADTLELTWEV